MLTIIERPFSKEESQALEDACDPKPVVTLSDTLRWLGLWSGIFLACVVLIGTGIALNPEGGLGVIWIGIVSVAGVAGLLSLCFAVMVAESHLEWRRYERRRMREDVPQIRAALEDGRAKVTCVETERAIVIQEFEDEGSAYIFDLGDGTSFYMRGQYVFPEKENAPWPAKRFEIVHSALNGRYVGIFAAEVSLKNVREIPMEEMPENFAWDDKLETETILPGSPDDVLARLGYREPVKP